MADPISSAINTQKTDTTSQTSKKAESKNELGKDAFLQLLVTQMKYQDPMNPGDSTQYMSQLAQYSSLEATMNISNTLEKGNALNLVGEYVIMNTTNSAGNVEMVSGLVEYATVKDGKVMLSIKDKYYPAEDLDSVVDYDYYLYLQSQIENANGTDTDENTNGDSVENDGNVEDDETK